MAEPPSITERGCAMSVTLDGARPLEQVAHAPAGSARSPAVPQARTRSVKLALEVLDAVDEVR